jgi:hypothetical protein
MDIIERLRTRPLYEGCGEESNIPDDAADEIERLRTVAVKRGLWKEAPCCVCGYNGPNYFQPSVHKCAAIEENE